MAKYGKTARKRQGRAPKDAAVAELKPLFENSDGIVFVNNLGLTVKQMGDLRNKLRGKNIKMKTAKNTLIRIAMEQAGYEVDGISAHLNGPTMVAFPKDDISSAAKTLLDWVKDNGDDAKLQVKAGLLGKEAIDAKGVESLSQMPSREQLIARIMGSMMAAPQNVVNVINNARSKVVYAVDAKIRKMEEGGGSSEAA